MEDWTLVGFVIANEREEYLAGYRLFQGGSLLQWSQVPDLAKVFKSRDKALKMAKKLDFSYPVWVLHLVDFGDQLAVFTDDENRPPWLLDMQ